MHGGVGPVRAGEEDGCGVDNEAFGVHAAVEATFALTAVVFGPDEDCGLREDCRAEGGESGSRQFLDEDVEVLDDKADLHVAAEDRFKGVAEGLDFGEGEGDEENVLRRRWRARRL